MVLADNIDRKCLLAEANACSTCVANISSILNRKMICPYYFALAMQSNSSICALLYLFREA